MLDLTIDSGHDVKQSLVVDRQDAISVLNEHIKCQHPIS